MTNGITWLILKKRAENQHLSVIGSPTSDDLMLPG